MKIIGIAGGIASGKSLVSAELESLGAAYVNADQIGHEILRLPEIKELIRDYWGADVFHEGEVDRRALAARVFAPPPEGPADLAQLEEITHPPISKRMEEKIEALRSRGFPAAIVDAAVMFKAGWDRFCDLILFVDAAEERRLDRARKRGWSEEEFRAREASQESLAHKRDRSDYEIDNNGSIESTQEQIKRIWDEHISLDDEY